MESFFPAIRTHPPLRIWWLCKSWLQHSKEPQGHERHLGFATPLVHTTLRRHKEKRQPPICSSDGFQNPIPLKVEGSRLYPCSTARGGHHQRLCQHPSVACACAPIAPLRGRRLPGTVSKVPLEVPSSWPKAQETRRRATIPTPLSAASAMDPGTGTSLRSSRS